ncbi:hypothetical protein FACS1894151_02120 [Spirochaetia bacterium]|nr:hypothetical protein FACS1894151_02120 [Spirochaetia bacterium]
MMENRLMTLDERLAIGVKCARLEDEGKEDEAIELAKTRPMPAYVAKILMEKVDWGKNFLQTCGWNMAEVEAKYGKNWLDNWDSKSSK